MKSIVGLLEYTVTGAFVWIIFIIFLAMVGVDAGPEVKKLIDKHFAAVSALPHLQGQPSQIVKEVIQIAIGGFLFVAIFLTGLVLDMLAPLIFAPLEIYWARKMLFVKPRSWFRELMDAHDDLVGDAYTLLSRPADTKDKGKLKRPVVWEIAKYRRLTAFLFSYVLATGKAPQLDEFQERLKVWRVTQALALAFLLLWIAVIAWSQLTWTGREPLQSWILGIFIPTLLAFFSYFAMQITFFRLAISLEASTFLGWKAAAQA